MEREKEWQSRVEGGKEEETEAKTDQKGEWIPYER